MIDLLILNVPFVSELDCIQFCLMCIFNCIWHNILSKCNSIGFILLYDFFLYNLVNKYLTVLFYLPFNGKFMLTVYYKSGQIYVKLKFRN